MHSPAFMQYSPTSMRLARNAHSGQTYGDFDYFEHHVEGVVQIARALHHRMGSPRRLDLVLDAAYLHDTIEDSSYTLDDLRASGIAEQVIAAVGLLTKPENFNKKTDLIPYLREISKNELARLVKMADITFNMTSCLLEENREKATAYFQQLEFLAKNH